MSETRMPGVVRSRFKVGEHNDGHAVEIPVVTITGMQPGTRLWIHAGVHGDEYTGLGAIFRLAKTIDPSNLRGNLILVPAVHIPAVNAMTRFSPFDGLDVANSYPGRPDGWLTERIADWMIQSIVERADVVIDMHTSEPWGDACGYVNCTPSTASVGREAVELGCAFALPWVVWPTRLHEETLLRPTLAKKGIPTISIELGGLGIWTELSVSQACQGAVNVMRHLGMLDGTPVLPPEQTIIERTHWKRCGSGGFYFSPHPPGAQVKAGGILGEVRDWFGETKEMITAPWDCAILIQRLRPVVRTGDEVALLGDLTTRMTI